MTQWQKYRCGFVFLMCAVTLVGLGTTLHLAGISFLGLISFILSLIVTYEEI